MNSIILISVIVASSSLLVNGQTKTTYCPSGYYTNYVSTAYTNKLSPVTTLAGVRYNSGGFYQVTASSGADQCCYNCATQTGGTCTTWTYDGCGTCYLSSATGSSNYLVSRGTTTTNTGCGYSRSCTPSSGFVSNNGVTTTTSGAATIPFPG